MITNRYYVVDVLKGIAILLVIMVHTSQRFLLPLWLRSIASIRQFGCQIFLVCSGFLLCYSWKNRIDTPKWLYKRYSRLAPGYYIAIMLAIVVPAMERVIGIGSSASLPGGGGIALNAFFLHGLTPEYCNIIPGGWYIGTTVILYALFPALYNIIDRLYRKKRELVSLFVSVSAFFSFGVWLLCSMIPCLGEYIGNNKFIYFSFITQLPCFAFGIEAYFDHSSHREYQWLDLLFGVTSAFLGLLIFFSEIRILLSVVPALISYGIKNILLRFIDMRLEKTWLKWIGERSYYIYLVHIYFAWTLAGLLRKVLISFVGIYSEIILFFFGLTLAVAFSLLFGEILMSAIRPVEKRLIGREDKWNLI